MTYDDYVIVIVNGQKVYGPSGIISIINTLLLLNLGITNINNIDLKPYLTQGNNNIRIDLGIVGTRRLDYKTK